jgi:CheY-like chemotaxis protein
LRPPLQRLRDTRDPATVEREASEGLSVLDRLISFARPAHGQRTLIDIGSMLRDLIELRSEAMRLALVRVEPEVIEAPLGAMGARSQLEQALLNVLVFAEQSLAAADHRVVYLSARMDGTWVAVRIRIEALAGGETESMLAVSRGVVEAHQGLWRMSTEQGQTVIEIRLPATASPQAAAESRKPARTLTLLAVVPEPAAMQQLSEALAGCGHRMVPASSGNDALLLASRFSFDGILATETLPDMHWSEFSSRAARAGLPPILLAAEGAPPPGNQRALRLPAGEAEIRQGLAELMRAAPRDRAS